MGSQTGSRRLSSQLSSQQLLYRLWSPSESLYTGKPSSDRFQGLYRASQEPSEQLGFSQEPEPAELLLDSLDLGLLESPI